MPKYKHRPKRGRNKKRTAWQQSRDNKLRNAKPEIDARRRHRWDNASSDGSSSESDHHDTSTADEFTLGRPSVPPVIAMCKPQLVGSDAFPGFVFAVKGQPVVVFDVRTQSSGSSSTEHIERLRPISLHQPRWIRADQWHVRSASTSLREYVVLGHSGECGEAAITVWHRETGDQLHTSYGCQGSVCFLIPLTSRQIISGDSGGCICVWDIKSGSLEY